MEKLSMSKLKDILRLKYESNLSARQIARALNVSHTVVNKYKLDFYYYTYIKSFWASSFISGFSFLKLIKSIFAFKVLLSFSSSFRYLSKLSL